VIKELCSRPTIKANYSQTRSARGLFAITELFERFKFDSDAFPTRAFYTVSQIMRQAANFGKLKFRQAWTNFDNHTLAR